MNKPKNFLEKQLKLSFILISLCVTPYFSFDSFNLPRFFLLLIFGSQLGLTLIINRKALISNEHNVLIFLGIGFISWSLIVTMVSDANVISRVIGGDGKYTGFITYTFLVIFMLSAVMVSRDVFNLAILRTVIGIGFISSLYGLIQSIDLDPIMWSSPNGNIFGISGNPNFHSAYMAVSAAAAFTLIFSGRERVLNKLFYVCFFLLAIYNIILSSSTQGVLLLLIGLMVYLIFFVKYKLPKFSLILILCSVILLIISILDILRKGPWPSFLYEPSVSYRGDYWRSAWRMTVDNPIFGFGFDNFKNNYRQFSDPNSNREGVSRNVDSAHNIFLEISSSGGFFLAILFIGINLLVFYSVIKIIWKNTTFNETHVGLVICWILLSVQAIISVPKIQLLVLQWILSGLIIGLNMSESIEVKKLSINYSGFIVSISILLAIVIAGPFLNKDAKFRSALESGNVETINKVIQGWPRKVEYFVTVAEIYKEAKLYDSALDVIRQAILVDRDSFESWELLASLPTVNESERSKAELRMQELDPTLLKS